MSAETAPTGVLVPSVATLVHRSRLHPWQSQNCFPTVFYVRKDTGSGSFSLTVEVLRVLFSATKCAQAELGALDHCPGHAPQVPFAEPQPGGVGIEALPL